MRSKIRFGIVGLGVQGDTYAKILMNNNGSELSPPALKFATLGGLCSSNLEKKRSYQNRYPSVPFFNNYQEMISSGEIDALLICVPHYHHCKIAIYAIEHNMPVLCEKPSGIYAKEVERLNQTSLAHPEIPFALFFNQRANKLYQQIKTLIDSKALGDIRRTNWINNGSWRPDSYYQQSEWRATWGGEGGGILVNQAVHQLDLWQWLCGLPKSVFSKVRYGAYRDIEVDNDVTAIVTYENGATGCFICTTHDPVGTDRFEIDFDAGKIVIEDGKKATIYRFINSESEMNQTMTPQELFKLTMGENNSKHLYTTETISHTDKPGEQHAKTIENFALHLLKKEPLLANGIDGIYSVNLINAILFSSWQNSEVSFPVNGDDYLQALNQKIVSEGRYPIKE